MRPVLLALVLVAALVALTAAGYLVLRPPFPPRGLLAYATSLEVTGSTGIRLVAADGTGARSVGGVAANTFDHSPRWSADGRTLLFARNDHLDAFGACGGVSSVVLYDVAAGTERVVATGLRPIDVVEWSPSEDSAAYLYPPPGVWRSCRARGGRHRERPDHDLAARRRDLGDSMGGWRRVRRANRSVGRGAPRAAGESRGRCPRLTALGWPRSRRRGVTSGATSAGHRAVGGGDRTGGGRRADMVRGWNEPRLRCVHRPAVRVRGLLPRSHCDPGRRKRPSPDIGGRI